MAQTSWPFENIDTSETQFSLWARNIGEGVIQNRGNELEPYGDGTGMNVKVKDGQALIRGHYYDNTGTETLTISAADPTNPRIDSVILRLDPTANTIVLAILTGTPAASPSAPALTQTDAAIYEVRLANIAVAAGAVVISAGNVTDTRSFNLSAADLQSSVTTLQGDVTTLQSDVATIESDLLTKGPLNYTVSDKSAGYSLVAGDNATLIRSTGSAITITVADVLPAGGRVDFIQAGAGQITFAGSGVTINSVDAKLKTNKQYSGATLFKAGGAYYLVGDLSA